MPLDSLTSYELVWVAVGFAGQMAFTARVLVQWFASEKKGDSVIPESFWYLSLVGGVTMLAYAVHRRDPVFTTGQMFGVVVYARNLYLIRRNRKLNGAPADRGVAVFDPDREEAPATLPLARAA